MTLTFDLDLSSRSHSNSVGWCSVDKTLVYQPGDPRVGGSNPGRYQIYFFFLAFRNQGITENEVKSLKVPFLCRNKIQVFWKLNDVNDLDL